MRLSSVLYWKALFIPTFIVKLYKVVRSDIIAELSQDIFKSNLVLHTEVEYIYFVFLETSPSTRYTFLLVYKNECVANLPPGF